MWWIYPVYIILLCLVVYLSIKLANLVDLLDKKTKISGAFIGGVLLAAVTSLPELFTSISAVLIVNDPSLVVGNILGSDIFNLVIVALYTVFFFKNFKTAKVDKWHLISLIDLLFMYLLAAYAIFVPIEKQLMLGSINVVSIVMFISYIVLLVKQPKESETMSDDEIKSKLTLTQIVVLFITCSLVLIGASIGITYVTDLITNEISWLGGTIAGAILLGVATSLPEVISTFHLFKIKNYDAGYGNMIGSCTFNFLVLSIADFISWSGLNGEIMLERGIFIANNDSKQLLVFGLITIISIGVLLVLKVYTKFFEKYKKSIIAALGLSCVSLASYLLVFIL